MKYFKHNVKQITKALFAKKTSVSSEKEMEYIHALSYIAQGHVFTTVANNGCSYLYFVPSFDTNLDIADSIFEKNGIYPVRHNSLMYHKQKVVLRIPCIFLLFNKRANKFIETLMCDIWYMSQPNKCRSDSYQKYFEKVQQELKQNVK